MSRLPWLIERPIAHRGLHDLAAGIVENTASAFHAAIAGHYPIESDLQISADGEAMVHHDDVLGRLVEGNEKLAALPAAELKARRFKAGNDRILTLGELCDLVASRVPLVIELKSNFDGDNRLVARTVDDLKTYKGRVALMSFDPRPIEALRHVAPALPRGIVVASQFVEAGGRALTTWEWLRLAYLLHVPRTRPHFISYAADDLPALTPRLARMIGVPVITWTIRSDAQRRQVLHHADQVTFEGFLA
jgi:glycerophosphoryl diester phosphodiesterase